MHFYTEVNGAVEPRHYVTQKSDPSKTRASRVTDAKAAKKAGETWYASVTSVLGILDKPALVNWKVDKHLEQAFKLLEQSFDAELLNYETFINTVKARTAEALDAAPQAGTDIHKVLEDCLFNEYDESQYTEIENKIIKAIENELNTREIRVNQVEQYFIEKEHGYAGCADLVCDGFVIDYKSKQEASKFKPGKMAYPEHYRQLAAYGRAFFGYEPFRAANIFICLETGEIDFHEHSQSDLMSGWMDFKDCLSIYKRNNYDESKI